MYGVPGVGAAPVEWTSTDGSRLACANSVITIAMTPRISRTTPALLMIAISRIPMMLITVVTVSKMTPSSTAFRAPLTDVGEGSPPRTWKPDQIDGSTAWSAMAAAATVRTCPMIMTQPGNQPNVCPASRDDHWKIAPAIGNRAARVEKFSATSSWPANTTGHVQKNAAPPKPKPRKKSWNTVVRIDTKENPAAKEAKLPTL